MEKMNPCMPDGITVFDVTDPVMKPGVIAFGQYRIELFNDQFFFLKLALYRL